MTAIKLTDTPRKRHKDLGLICDQVLMLVMPDSSHAVQRLWARVFFVYLMWWEGNTANTRTQFGSGPGRGLMQFEPATVRDLYDHYSRVLGKETIFTQYVGSASGLSSAAVKTAFDAFLASARPTNNRWPISNSNAAAVENWLLSDDSFGICLMYLQLKRGTAKKIPPKIAANLNADPHADQSKSEHAEAWAKYWKRSFASANDRKQQIAKFIQRAKDSDSL